jgi:hypothetical protein
MTFKDLQRLIGSESAAGSEEAIEEGKTTEDVF